MNQNLIIISKNLIYSGIVGTIVYFLLGWLAYDVLFPDLHSGGETNMVWIFLGCLFYAFSYATILVHWAQIKTLKSGFNAGLVLGVLFSISWLCFGMDGGFDAVNFLTHILVSGFTTAFMAASIGYTNGKV